MSSDEKAIQPTDQEQERGLQPASKDPVSIEVKNLIVASIPKERLVIGTPRDIVAVTKASPGVKAIIWCEEAVSLMLADRSVEIMFEPELDPTVKAFFKREERRHYNDFSDMGTRVWEGDYATVRFTKKNLLKFISQYESDVPTEVREAIKNLKLTKSSEAMTVALDDDTERFMEDEKVVTNLPKKFILDLPLAYGVRASMEFEAVVIRDNYGKGKPTIDLRCVNGRAVLRDMMENITRQMPPGIPRYYGRLNLPKRGD